MSMAMPGTTVKVHYIGRLKSGAVFGTSVGRDPLKFTIGQGEIMPSLEREVVGMNLGESKTAHIEAKDAYGPHRPDRVLTLERELIPSEIEPQVGNRLQMVQEDGEELAVTVKAVTPEKVILDANHPLAGEDLIIQLELVEVDSGSEPSP